MLAAEGPCLRRLRHPGPEHVREEPFLLLQVPHRRNSEEERQLEAALEAPRPLRKGPVYLAAAAALYTAKRLEELAVRGRVRRPPRAAHRGKVLQGARPSLELQLVAREENFGRALTRCTHRLATSWSFSDTTTPSAPMDACAARVSRDCAGSYSSTAAAHAALDHSSTAS